MDISQKLLDNKSLQWLAISIDDILKYEIKIKKKKISFFKGAWSSRLLPHTELSKRSSGKEFQNIGAEKIRKESVCGEQP